MRIGKRQRMDTPLDPIFLADLIEALAGTLCAGSADDAVMAAHRALAAFAPGGLVEAILAARMIAAHHASIDSFRRAMLPGVADADAVRLRNNAIAAGRSFDAAQRILDRRRAPAGMPGKPAPHKGPPPHEAAPVEDELAAFTPEEIAAAEYALDNDPADLARAELAKRIPLHMFDDMTMEERRIAYAERAPMTPVQIAVLGARITASNRKPAAPGD
jgi:hypothetical protein